MPPLVGGPALRWGIAGPGRIAAAFAQALLAHTDQEIVAVGSRSPERAERFARTHHIPRAWPSYEALVGDPTVDIVYVAVPNSEHRAVAELALQAGHHVLVEKPLAVDEAEAASLFAAAHRAGCFLMEGMWSRFLPHTLMVEQVINEGIIGDITEVQADFGEAFDPATERSVFDPRMAGGALRDIGVYPVWFAQFLLGAPESIEVTGRLTDSGVDGESELHLRFGRGRNATVRTSLFQRSDSTATVTGRLARLDVAGPFLMPAGLTLVEGTHMDRWDDPWPLRGLSGLAWEAAAVARHISDGQLQSSLHPPSATLQLAHTLDTARTRLGAP